MLKRLLACVVITALIAPGCRKKATPPAAGSGAGSGAIGGATSGDLGGGSGGAAAAGTPGPATQAAGAFAAATSQANAALLKTVSAAPAAEQATVVDKMLDAAIASAKTIARERSWDPSSVIAKVGTDRAKLFTWVRTQTALVPYVGTLRGAVGVMMDRVGNSLDRSLLLADLLVHAGSEVQLAHATLEPALAQQLAAAWQKTAKPAFPTTPEDPVTTAALGAAFGDGRAAFEKQVAAQTAARMEIAKRARAQTETQAGALVKLIEGTPAAAPTDAAAFADHWWVQVKDGDAWSDLDPTQPGPGQTLVPAAETMARDAVPDALKHTLALRVIGEVWHGDTREETTLVEHAFAPADFYGQRIAITSVGLDMPEPEKLAAEKDRAAALRNAIVAQKEWMPVIYVGVAPIAHFSVTDGGELYNLMDPNEDTTRMARAVQHATKNGVGGATDMLEGLPDGSGQTPPPKPVAAPHSGFTAEWFEVEVRAPNTAPRIVRRPIFDALGAPANRDTAKPVNLDAAQKLERGLAQFGTVEVLPQYARVPAEYSTDRLGKYLTAAKPTIVALVKGGGVNPPDPVTAELAKALPPPDDLDNLAQMRFEWSPANTVFVDQIDVLTARRRLISANGTYQAHAAFDILTNGVGSWGTPAEARAARVAQGIADTVAESALKPCEIATPCFHGPNTSDAYVGAKDWALFRDASAPAVTKLPGRLAAGDVAQGYAVVAATSGQPATWWRVRPDTGETLGQTAHGGGEYVDRLVVLNTVGRILAIEFGYLFCMTQASSVTRGAACAVGVTIAGGGAYMAAGALTQIVIIAGILIAGMAGTSIPP